MKNLLMLFVIVCMGCATHKSTVEEGMMSFGTIEDQKQTGIKRALYTAQVMSLCKDNEDGGYRVGLDIYAVTHRLKRATPKYSKILSLLKYSENKCRKLLLTVEYGKGLSSPRIVAAKKVDE